MIIQAFFKFQDFSMHGTILAIFQVFHDFQSLWELCVKGFPVYKMLKQTDLDNTVAMPTGLL